MTVDERGTGRPDRREGAWAEMVARFQAGAAWPFEAQWAQFLEVFGEPDPRGAPPIAWRPTADHVAGSNLGRWMRELGHTSYSRFHRWSVENRADFWRGAIERVGIVFRNEPARVLERDGETGRWRWLPGARLNCADSCFLAEDDRPAIIEAGEEAPEPVVTSYAALKSLADRVAGGLAAAGLETGDAVALYMPMTGECVAAYLGVVRAGCRVVSIAESFPAPVLRRRLETGGAKLVVTAERGTWGGRAISPYAEVLRAGAPPAVVVGESEPRRRGDLSWRELVGAKPAADSVTCDPDAVTNVLFSSGTTGTPKAIPWTHLTPIKCAVDGCFHLDVRNTDVVAWPTSIGWMMGPWLVYAALMNRATVALYAGTPGGPGFARFVETARVSVLGVVPSLVRSWRESGATADADWSAVRLFGSTGEPSTPQDYLWLMSRTAYRSPVIEYCGGTEIGGAYVTGTVVQPASPATFTTPALGLDLVLLDEQGTPVTEGEPGEAFLVPPAIGLSDRLLNADHDAVYHEGTPRGAGGEPLRRHGDRMVRLPGGFFRALGRADDAMNLGGIKVAPLEIEQVAARHESVAEVAAVAVAPRDRGTERLVLFVVPSGEVERTRLAAELGNSIAAELNPLFKVHDLVLVPDLPRTATNKLLRRELRERYVAERGT
jgi:acetyl-CoA synthetase